MHTKGFEEIVGSTLRRVFPWCVISNVRLFDPRVADSEDPFGVELDYIVHFRTGTRDHILIVECKFTTISFVGSDILPQALKDWVVSYWDKKKSAKQQIARHASILKNLLGRSSADTTVIGFIVSGDPNTPTLKDLASRGATGLRFVLGSLASLEEFCRNTIRTERAVPVALSPLLGVLHSGNPDIVLGHPEPARALAFIEHCRRRFDCELFRLFAPSKRYWAINGSAGMGKSLLLVYSAFVFASDMRVVEEDDTPIIGKSKNVKLGLPGPDVRKVVIYALTERQLGVLHQFWENLRQFLLRLKGFNGYRIGLPYFRLWRDGSQLEGNVVLIDEAHDLSDSAQNYIAQWISDEAKQRYLVLGCDRHQKLLATAKDEPLLGPLKFSGHTRRLWRNYRNPFPIFAASISLMFRWYASTGPKVVPSMEHLRDGLGLRVVSRSREGKLTIACRNDAHPANAWANMVLCTSTADTAWSWLEQSRLISNDVLWVRFSEEDPDFDYDRLRLLSFYSLARETAAQSINRYIKGREFSVVVIEGYWKDGEHMESEEDKLWIARRQLFMCASRSRGFLVLIPPRNNAEILSEYQTITSAFRAPKFENGGNSWVFEIAPTPDVRRYSVFIDAEDSEGEKDEIEIIPYASRHWSAHSEAGVHFGQLERMCVKDFAQYLGTSPTDVISELLGNNVTSDFDDEVPEDLIVRICADREVPLPLQR